MEEVMLPVVIVGILFIGLPVGDLPLHHQVEERRRR